ncbi:hypothetical protein OEA41_009458 [Lepraria neglecta]|uniref:O-methyltransferase C-terminal domain-containing protein n=1 Tax=Lepraria neglecta TaxID=209136 RepID=A0AAD9Z3L6_9LECA|nr:hypothetical protein OEA41_009458 [Lepraria neglecta]
MSAANIEALGKEIQRLSVTVARAWEDGTYHADSRDELIDTLDDLRAELVGPMRWPGTFLAPPEFAALQVAFHREIFQHVPGGSVKEGKASGEHLTNGNMTNGNGHRVASSIHARDLAAFVLVRIMRVLVVNKMFVEVDDKVFAHTPEFVAARLGGIFNEVYKASSSLAEAIDNGSKKTAWETRFGMPLYEYFEKNPSSDRERMQKSMTISSTAEIEELASLFPWKQFHKIVDIGGSAGYLLINDDLRRINKMPPDEKATFDKVEFEAYNYFDPQPRKDADAFILRRCLHNNPDSECVKILKAVVPGLENGGRGTRLLINERLMPASSTQHKTKMLRREDIVMMISVGGKERTLEEFDALIKQADERFEVCIHSVLSREIR